MFQWNENSEYSENNEYEQLIKENERLKLEIWLNNASPRQLYRLNRKIHLESIGIDSSFIDL